MMVYDAFLSLQDVRTDKNPLPLTRVGLYAMFKKVYSCVHQRACACLVVVNFETSEYRRM